MESNGAVHEGKAAFLLGLPLGANPYHKALATGGPFSDDRLAGLIDLECQWDSGYAGAKRTMKQTLKMLGRLA